VELIGGEAETVLLVLSFRIVGGRYGAFAIAFLNSLFTYSITQQHLYFLRTGLPHVFTSKVGIASPRSTPSRASSSKAVVALQSRSQVNQGESQGGEEEESSPGGGENSHLVFGFSNKGSKVRRQPLG